MTAAKKIGLKVYLEGVAIPCYRAMVQTSIGAPAIATIDCPPAEEFFDRYEESPAGSGNFVQKLGVQPRTLVHIFYEDSEDPDDVPRLLFEGEFVRFEYSKTASSRSLRMVARDVSNILSSIYVRYYSDFFTPYGNLMSIFTGQATADKPNAESLRLSLIGMGTGLNPEVMNAIQSDPNGFGIASALKDIVTKALGTNTFFSGFNDRTKVKDKIVTLADTTSRLLLDATQLASLVQQNLSNLKESATVWDLYSMLMSMVFYFPVPVAAAPYLPTAVTDVGSADKGSKTFQVSPGKTLMSLMLKPYTWFTAPPNFNVIFPGQYKTFTLRRDFLSEPTRLITSAFGILESTAEEELKNFLPSQYMFVAPRSLAERFDREAYDSQFTNVLTSASVKAAETNIASLKEQRRQAEMKTLDPKVSAAQKVTIRSQLVTLDQQILQAQNELVELIDKIRQQGNIQLASESSQKRARDVRAQLWNRNVLTANDDVSLASREDLKGIVFAFDYMTQTQVEVSKAKGISPTALKEYLANIADYKLVLQQHKDRISEMTLEFSPQILPGFPTLVIDPVRNYFGEMDVVTHILDANGVADTQVQISFVRNDEVEFSELSRNKPGSIQFPKWINPSYLPTSVGAQVYGKLFPKNKPDASKPGIPAASSIMSFAPSNAQTQIAAAARIRQLYFNAKDQHRFSAGFTRRNIASMDQTFSVLGAVKNGSNFVFNSFSDERFKAALAYAKAANKVQTQIPTDAGAKVNA